MRKCSNSPPTLVYDSEAAHGRMLSEILHQSLSTAISQRILCIFERLLGSTIDKRGPQLQDQLGSRLRARLLSVSPGTVVERRWRTCSIKEKSHSGFFEAKRRGDSTTTGMLAPSAPIFALSSITSSSARDLALETIRVAASSIELTISPCVIEAEHHHWTKLADCAS
ncbi:telomerase reverse transcriptase [Colletotrichum sp. SAR 10_70]|nr:telomerase reverse transcriptase [Colletotrichum sp. SAR 10_71]KAI8152172.1 telomerase reverse transcriptase [Colletotrichum sp. SAR 10_70]